MAIGILQRVGMAFALLGVAACSAAEPFEYTPASEIPPGPGLLSGADGEFVIYRSPVAETRKSKPAAE